jgi:hypothetical protein
MPPQLFDAFGNPIPESDPKAAHKKSRSTTRRRYLWAVVITLPVLASLLGIGFRLYGGWGARKELTDTYPRIEQLIAIHSLLNWFNGVVLVKSDTDYGGEEIILSALAKDGQPGALFEAFTKKRKVTNPFDGEVFEGLAISPNEDVWYKFTCESLFGYELDVTVNPASASLYRRRDAIHAEEHRRLVDELGENYDREAWGNLIYALKVDGLSASKRMEFLVSNGVLVWYSNGTVRRREGWVVYLDDADEPITPGQLNKFIQIAARKLNFSETDLSKVVPQLEAMWMAKDRAFLDSFFSELEKIPELEKFSAFIDKGR